MSNANWVCFDCRTSQRRSNSRFGKWIVGSIGEGSILCPNCKAPCRFIGYKIAVPPRSDDNGWKQLREYVNQRRGEDRDMKAQFDARRKHAIERKISELQQRPKNNERDRLIKELRKKLEQFAAN